MTGERVKVSHSRGNRPYVLVEGPKFGDAEFYGKWLRAVARAEALWKEALEDQDFGKEIWLVGAYCIPDFGIGASVMLMELQEYWRTFVLQLDSLEGNEFAMMVQMGFFTPFAEHYRMTIPSELTDAKIKAAVLKFAQTQDEHGLHPECLVNTMLFDEAREWQNRIWALDKRRDHLRVEQASRGSRPDAGHAF